MADDVRIAQWDLRASAGTTVELVFTATETLTSLSVYTGGTVTDVDDLTDATEHAATLSTTTEANDTATVDVVVPTGNSVPLRLVVDGAVVSVGRLTPSTSGTASPDNTISLAPASYSFTLTIPGIVSSGGGGGVSDHGVLTGLSDDDHTLYALADGTRGDFATVAQGALADTAVQPTALAGYQPVDSDLTAIAALTTTAFGRGLLALVDAAAGRTALGVYSTAQTDAAIAALVDAAPGTLDTLNELAAALGDDPNFATTISTALAGKQPLDADLTAIAALTTTAYGRSLLEAANAAAARTLVGLGSVDNTSDLSKPVSTATQTSLDLKAPIASPTFTGTPAAPTPTAGDNTTKVATTAFVKTATDALSGAYLPLAGGTLTGDLTLAGDATAALEPVTKQQLDSATSDVVRDSDVGVQVQAYDADLAALAAAGNSATLAATTAAFTSAKDTKLGGIETGAQVNTVTSVASKTGAVTLAKGDVGLGNADNTSDANKPVSTAQQTALDAKANVAQAVNAQTGTTYTLVAADAGKLVTLSNAGAVTLTVPQDSDATIAVGTYIDLMQLGAGQVTVVAGTGATLRVSGLTAKARAQYARLGLQKVSANTWSLFGDLAAS